LAIVWVVFSEQAPTAKATPALVKFNLDISVKKLEHQGGR
jgi:hypothetical protein